MLSNLKVVQSYQGNGSTTAFSITQDIIINDSSELLVYIRDETDPANITITLQTEGALQDYTLTGASPPSQPFDDTVEFTTAPTADQQVWLVRALPLTQTQDLDPNVGIPADSTEKTFDRMVAMIQQLAEKLERTIKFNITSGISDVENPDPVATTFIGWDSGGTALKLYTVSELAALVAADGTGSIPAGGDQYALLEKQSSTDSDAAWTDPLVYQGYTERFSELVDLSGAKATLDYIMNMGYAPPTVSLGTSPNYATIREKGDTQSSVDLTATIVKVLDNIATVRFYRGATLLDTQSSGGGIPSGGASTYTDATPFSDNVTYSVQVDDDSAQAKPSATSTRNFVFVYPYYYGVGAASLGASVSGLTKQLIAETTSTSRSFTVDGTEKMYFAYPASYGVLANIFDINNFDTIGDWTKTVANITGLDGNPVSYNIYEFNNYAVAGSYQYTFKQ